MRDIINLIAFAVFLLWLTPILLALAVMAGVFLAVRRIRSEIQTNKDGGDMQHVIWKHVLEVTDYQRHSLPDDAEILDVQFQNGELCVWFACSSDAPKREFGFFIFGTGQPIPDNIYNYIGTVQVPPLAWHVFLEEDEE